MPVIREKTGAGKTGKQMKAAASERLEDTWKLFEAKRFVGALYMGGYGIECLMKWALTDANGKASAPKAYAGKQWPDLDWMLKDASFRDSLIGEGEAFAWWSAIIQWEVAWRDETTLPPDFGKNQSVQVRKWLETVDCLVRWLT